MERKKSQEVCKKDGETKQETHRCVVNCYRYQLHFHCEHLKHYVPNDYDYSPSHDYGGQDEDEESTPGRDEDDSFNLDQDAKDETKPGSIPGQREVPAEETSKPGWKFEEIEII